VQETAVPHRVNEIVHYDVSRILSEIAEMIVQSYIAEMIIQSYKFYIAQSSNISQWIFLISPGTHCAACTVRTNLMILAISFLVQGGLALTVFLTFVHFSRIKEIAEIQSYGFCKRCCELK
jgi:hypothetical protein